LKVETMIESSHISNNSGPGSAAEPSMEEILASIRRILKEDEGSQAEIEQPDDDVLLLDASMIVASADISTATELPAGIASIQTHDAPPFTTYHEPVHFASEPTIDTHIDEQAPLAPEIVPFQGHEMENIMEEHVQSPEGLIGEDTSNEITGTIGSLIRSISSERSVAVSRGGITIEEIVREEIRPVLKAWLDTHLPSLVERIVRAEIGRVIDRTQI
jgi:cell pole-organizing protein PopZ